MKSDKFVQNLIATTAGGVCKHTSPRHHLVRNPTETSRHFPMGMPRILAGFSSLRREVAEIIIARHQVVGDREDRLAETPVGLANERTVSGETH